MEKLILWGTENIINEYLETVGHFVSAGDITVLGICFKHPSAYKAAPEEKYPFIAFGAPEWETADCVLVCTEKHFDEDLNEVISIGVAREKLIPCCLLSINGFSFSRYMQLSRSRVSILSNCCWGGLTYNYFKLPFLSPTINLLITDDDYILFLEHLDQMLDTEPVFSRMDYNSEEDIYYPVFDIAGVKLHMRHCTDRKQGLSDWNSRCSRINHDNLLVTMITDSVSSAERFAALSFRKKVCFVPFQTQLPFCVHVDPGIVPLVSYVNSFATGTRRLYDPWILLEEGRISYAEEDQVPSHRVYSMKETEVVLNQAEAMLIYGAQAMGTRAYNMIKDFSSEKLLGFAVTSTTGNPAEKYGYPVRSTEEWAKIFADMKVPANKIAVFTALHPQYYDTVRKTLIANGFQSIFSFEELEWYYYKCMNTIKSDIVNCNVRGNIAFRE